MVNINCLYVVKIHVAQTRTKQEEIQFVLLFNFRSQGLMVFEYDMEITQIQVRYLDQQDRMVMRINMDADKHLSMLLTRRICRFMLENLNALLQIDIPAQGLAESVVKTDFQCGQVQGDSASESFEPPPQLDMATPFQERAPEGNVLAQSSDALLVANASCNRTKDSLSFTFFIEGLQPVNLNLSASLALGVHQLLSGVATQAQWFSGLAPFSQESEQQTLDQSGSGKNSITYH